MTSPTTPSTPSGHPLVPDTSSWLRRVGALLIDWLAAYAVAFFILRDVQNSAFGSLTLAIFLLESAVGVALTGSSFGQTLLRIHVRHLDGRPLSLFSALIRQGAVCLVIPPLVFRGDGRGLHDLWTHSAAYDRTRA
ncbi:MAG: RDD family protein [Marmoricola sp.]